ncbi:Haem-binding domain-containing protein [Lutibacter oricola]|uniref:Haem-binding domain-containing protein n=1 Tax=Lutibacter oricola TaxID=762486 RepID=A0A1H3EX13_9FLAO|nr:heme-binding domain-containing protein [Lutibacter oricola]SDX83140.1 Haem-binding domain-containing protein [Lutibacter oricola]
MKKIVLGVLVVLLLIQFVRPTKNESKNYENDISTVVETPKNVKQILKTSCNDCHSNLTVYPWYSEIAPVSWYLASHVNEGKEYLNFSEWTSYNKFQKEHILSNFDEVLDKHQMPLKSYLIMHKEATLTKEQIEVLKNWIKTIKID